MLALTDHPDQQRVWMDDFERRRADRGRGDRALGDAGHPLPPHRDRATPSVGGQQIKAGEKVVMFYNSANRDERRSTTRSASTSRRAPNEHVGFGAGGPHFCLGANLARREIRVMFEELFRRLPDIEISGEPDCLQSSFIHGIKRMPCAFTPS